MSSVFFETFRYVVRMQRKRVIGTIALSLMLISLSIPVIIGFINGVYSVFLETILPDKNNIISIYSGSALTPYTGLISRGYEELFRNKTGVLMVWSELIVPTIINEKPIIVRGIEDNYLLKLTNECGKQSNSSKTLTLTSAWVGSDAARYLNVKVNNTIIVSSMFSNIQVPLEVVCILNNTAKPYSNEVIVALPTAQILRNVNYSTVSVIKILYDPSMTSYDKILMETGLELENSKHVSIPLYLFERAVILISTIHLGTPQLASTWSFIEKLGFSKEIFYATSIILVTLLSISIYMMGKYVIIINTHNIETLRSIGVSRRTIIGTLAVFYATLTFILTTIFLIAIPAIIGVFLSTNMYMLGYHIETRIPVYETPVYALVYAMILTLGLFSEIKNIERKQGYA